jgi:hypothetical protein
MNVIIQELIDVVNSQEHRARNKALHRTAIPLRSIAAGELWRSKLLIDNDGNGIILNVKVSLHVSEGR